MRLHETKSANHAAPGDLLAVVEAEGAWRLFINAQRLGRFSSHADAMQCALEIARRTRAEGRAVEVLDQTAFGEVTLVADSRVH